MTSNRHGILDTLFSSGGSPLLRWAALGILAGVAIGIVVALFALVSGGGDDGPGVVITPISTTADTQPATADPAPSTPSQSVTTTEPDDDAATTSTTTEPAGEDTTTATTTTAPDDEDTTAATTTAPAGDTATTAPASAPTVSDLDELHRRFGEAPDATLGRLRIPVLGVDAAVGRRYVDAKMPNPTGPGDVVWYDFSEWDGLGGVPGGGGNAVFSGHVDYNLQIPWAEAHYRGEGVFYALNLLSPGDVIEVEVGGKVMQYTVKWTRQVEADGPDNVWLPILSGDVSVDSITLITCGGEFDVATKTYRDRFIVRAERA
ncbi:MAG: class F sortase [Chloroflexota bacterium]|nr:class F sortase [Chloroflexota bacterium]